MYPVNQVFLGGDPLLGSSSSIDGIQNIDEQIKYLEQQRNIIENAQKQRIPLTQPSRLIWDDIDSEISPMTDEQKRMLFQNSEYVDIYNNIQELVQAELLNLVKGKIESTKEGKDLLNSQLKLVKKLKGNIIDSTNKEMEVFKRFKEFSKDNPNITYEEFINNKENGNK